MQSRVASLSADRPEPLAAAAQRVPSATGSGDEIDEFVMLQGSVNRPELILPQFLTVGPQYLEDTALRIRATDHGASMEIERMRCEDGGPKGITHDDGVARKPGEEHSTFCHVRDGVLRGNSAADCNERKET